MGRITSSSKQLAPDPRYGSMLASKFVNLLMWAAFLPAEQQEEAA
jgi:hypothetical protein